MRRIYTEVDGAERLAFLKCDLCGAVARPGDECKGWMKRGVYYGPGDPENFEEVACPIHVNAGDA